MAAKDHLAEESPEENVQAEPLSEDHPAFSDESATIEFDPPENRKAEPPSPEPPTPEELLAAEKDRVLRLQAELQNTLQRKSRELAEVRKYDGLALMKDVLPVLDNIDRAIEHAEKASGDLTSEGSSLLEGFKLVRQQLVTALAGHECQPIDAVGEPFNPDLHEAILQQPSPDHPPGTVIMMTQTGYKLHDRVVRPAQVIVSSGEG